LSEQEKRLADLRSRSGTILAGASIAGSFLATKNGDVDTFAALAIVAYVLCVVAAADRSDQPRARPMERPASKRHVALRLASRDRSLLGFLQLRTSGSEAWRPTLLPSSREAGALLLACQAMRARRPRRTRVALSENSSEVLAGVDPEGPHHPSAVAGA
jgi:hypothetical protein